MYSYFFGSSHCVLFKALYFLRAFAMFELLLRKQFFFSVILFHFKFIFIKTIIKRWSNVCVGLVCDTFWV